MSGLWSVSKYGVQYRVVKHPAARRKASGSACERCLDSEAGTVINKHCGPDVGRVLEYLIRPRKSEVWTMPERR